MDIQQVARQAARAIAAPHLTIEDAEHVADAVAVAVLHRVTEAMTEKLTPALNTGTAFDLLVIVGQTIRELGAAFTPAEPPPQETEMIDKRSTGLYAKFTVTRTDGKSAPGEKHDGCDYFVLDVTHDKHAHAALKAYADSCEGEYPLLARDVRIQAKTQILSGLVAPAEPQTPEPEITPVAHAVLAVHEARQDILNFVSRYLDLDRAAAMTDALIAAVEARAKIDVDTMATLKAAWEKRAYEAEVALEPAAPVSSSARPDRQTVEPRPGDACRFCPYPRDSRVHEADVEPKHGGHRFELRERPPNVVQEQADARPALRDAKLFFSEMANCTRCESCAKNAQQWRDDHTTVVDALLSGGAPHGR